MLELSLVLQNHQVSVQVNGKKSHTFSLLDVHWPQTEAEIKDFVSSPREIGANLFQALFKGDSPARAGFDALSKQPERTIVLVLESPDPSTSLRASLDGIAWEYAYNKAKQEYVVEDCAFVRALPLLFIPANPLVDLSGEPMRALDVEGELREMKGLIEKSNAPFDMIELRPATPEALQSVMARFQKGMVAHFSGHGAATKDGAILLFERENGASNPLEAREFVREIKDKAWIGFLSACQSAVPERTEFSNLARELAKAGVPFALGMQFNLPDPFAPNISGQFYNYLAHGHAVPEAARQARRAVKRENEFFVGMIALYAGHPDEAGKITWHGSGAQTHDLFSPADVSDLPSPASGLIGRQRELMRIGTRLLEGKKPLTVTLHGAGGIGKTALLWQALLRFAPSFELTLVIGLDPLPSLESVLGRVERFLGLPSPCANDTKERETLVRSALTRVRTLLGLDNFETLNFALNEKSSEEEKTAKSLHSFFKSLAANGVTLCVTSREVTNLPGETIEDIEGLSNESGGRLFQENVVKQKDEIYIEKTQQVSEMVGGHPLALRLLASAFDDQAGTSLDRYIENLQSFLPQARDKWTEEDRHESLRASFDFTMNNLRKIKGGKKLQIALSRLSVFTAYFLDFTVAPVLENHFPASEISEKLSDMRPNANKTLQDLWGRGLLERTAIPLDKENAYLYRLHPTLGFFAKECLTNAITVKENYWKSMNYLACIAADLQIHKSSLMAQVALSAMPDLLVAAEVGNNKDSALMQFRAGKLLKHFGLYDASLRLLGKSRDTNQILNNLRGKSAAQNSMAQIHVIRGDLNGAMKLYQQSLEIDQSLGDPKASSANLSGMANILRQRGDLDGAMKLYRQSMKIQEELGDLEYKVVTMIEMANIYVARGDFDTGLNLQREALATAREIGDKHHEGVVLHEIGRIYMKLGNLDGAMQLYYQSLEIKKGFDNPQEKSSTLHEMGTILFKQGNLDEAMKLYQQALAINDDLGDLRSKAITVGMMGQTLWKGGHHGGAIASFLPGLMLLIQSKIEPQIQQKMISILLEWRMKLGAKKFDDLWHEEIGQPIPEWLMPKEKQGILGRIFKR